MADELPRELLTSRESVEFVAVSLSISAWEGDLFSDQRAAANGGCAAMGCGTSPVIMPWRDQRLARVRAGFNELSCNTQLLLAGAPLRQRGTHFAAAMAIETIPVR